MLFLFGGHFYTFFLVAFDFNNFLCFCRLSLASFQLFYFEFFPLEIEENFRVQLFFF